VNEVDYVFYYQSISREGYSESAEFFSSVIKENVIELEDRLLI
jgi:hypothetical protein